MNYHGPILNRCVSFEARLLDRQEFCALDAAQWDRLARCALVENPWYERRHVLAGLHTVDSNIDIWAFTVWSSTGELVGLFPFSRVLGVACGARNRYQFSGTPLIHREHAAPAVWAWLASIVDGRTPAAWHLRDLRLEGEFFDLVAATAAQLGLQLHRANTYSRPRLTRALAGFEQHVSSVLSKSRRKDVERNLRRLRELGTLSFERATSPELVEQRLEQFLVMERAGWKGRAGTAFLCDPKSAAFARAAYRAQHEGGQFTSIDALLLDERPVALSINIASGEIAFTPKCTYDESLRRWSPGLVLEYLVIEHFHADRSYAEMDSAATVTGHVVQGLWNEIVPMGELVVGKGRHAALTAGTLRIGTTTKSMAKTAVKEARRLLAAALRRSGQ